MSIRVSAVTKNFDALGGLEKFTAKRALEIFNQGNRRAAEHLRIRVFELYADGVPGHAPIHWFTKQERKQGGSQPLWDTGTMARAVQVFAAKQGQLVQFAVGIDGELGEHAAVLESGAVIRVTPARRAWLHSKGFHLRDNTKFLVIPARPVFLPALLKARPEMEAILEREFEKALSEQSLIRTGANTAWNGLKRLFKR